jgi:hypothetical protein
MTTRKLKNGNRKMSFCAFFWLLYRFRAVFFHALMRVFVRSFGLRAGIAGAGGRRDSGVSGTSKVLSIMNSEMSGHELGF